MQQINEKKIDTNFIFSNMELVEPRLEISNTLREGLKAAFNRLSEFRLELDNQLRNVEVEKWVDYYDEVYEVKQELENLLKRNHHCIWCFKHVEDLSGHCDACTGEMFEEYLKKIFREKRKFYHICRGHSQEGTFGPIK